MKSLTNTSVVGLIVLVVFVVGCAIALGIHLGTSDPVPAYQVITVDGVKCVTYYTNPVSCDWSTK